MAKKATKPARTPARSKKRGGGLPEPSGDAPSSLNPFLKADDIGKREGSSAALTLKPNSARVVDGNFGEQIVIAVKHNGKSYDWGVTVDSVNHRMLFDRFGADPGSWRGTVRVEVKKSRQNRNYIAVVGR